MNSACLRNRARNASVLSFGTTKVLARTMGPVFSLNCANSGVCGSRLCNVAIFGTSSRCRSRPPTDAPSVNTCWPTSVGQHLLATVSPGRWTVNTRWPTVVGMTGAPKNPQAARRSDATRATILAAARERFAADGYEKATIRAIARDAKIDPSMVMRYYGSKADLFAAAVSIDPGLPGLPLEPREEIGRTLVRHFLSLWEDNDELTALMRVGATDPAAADRMQSVLRDQLIP